MMAAQRPARKRAQPREGLNVHPMITEAGDDLMPKKKSGKKSTGKTSTRKSARKSSARKYGSAAGKQVKTEMHEMKRGKLRSGRSGKKVTSRKQAIAIGLSKAREKGAKVPKKKS
jgi:hypothetical protein